MSSSIWEVLGIAATRETVAIRRAYARKLKTTQPEDDPEGFKVLRAAYETALRIASDVAESAQLIDQAAATAAASAHGAAATRPHPAPEPDPIDPELLHLQAALHGLARALRTREKLPATVYEHLRGVLHSPVLANIQIEQQVEAQLAQLLAHSIPHSDPLLGSAAQRFGWRRDAHRLADAPAAILARLRDLEFLESLQSGDSPYAAAFASLQRPPIAVWSWLRAHVHRANRIGGYQLLTLLRDQHPALLDLLDEKAVAWWDRFVTRPQPSILLVTLGACFTAISVLTGFVMPPDQPRLGLPLAQAAIWAGVVLWRLFLIDWPRALMQRRWPLGAPIALKIGWLPLAAASVLMATTPVGAVLPAIVALLALQWTWITVRPIALGGLRQLNLATLMTVFGPALIAGLWWIAMVDHFTPASVVQLLIPALVLMLTSALGVWETQACWVFDLTALQRRTLLGVLLGWCLAGAAAVWWLAPAEQWRPLCAALLLIALCLQRPVHLTNRQLSVVMGVWAVGLVVSAGLQGEPAIQLRTGALASVGMVFDGTVLLTVLCGVWNEITGVVTKLARGDYRH